MKVNKKIKIGIIVLCRYNSSRLPGKALKLLNGRSVLGHILDRLSYVSNQIIVATSDQKSDDEIEKFCNYSNVECYRGSLNNVSNRFLSVRNHYEFRLRCKDKWR
jgi:spore coat polysaccharide biosynthesis protein SpsF